MAMNYIASDFNLSTLQKEVKRLQQLFSCKICKQRYKKAWCPADESRCIFCTHFDPIKHTRHFILRENEWHFIRSGEDNRAEYNRQYIHYLHLWCNRFRLPLYKEDMELEDELYSMN
jgi:hypothetical protein